MLKLRSVILQLSDQDYVKVADEFQQNKAEKFHTLLRLYRENALKEEHIHEQLGINQSAFYTLKSRLFDKIQTHLLQSSQNSRMELLRNVANIHKLVHETHRDLAIAILTKLEKELLLHDMPNELTTVYNALKKLHLHSPKHYEYTQLYNRHVAYTIALDKAESLLASFSKMLGEYFLSRDPKLAELLWLMKKEMFNVCRLYQSHHLAVYNALIDISFALFVPLPEAVKDDKPVEEMLDSIFTIFTDHPKDEGYVYLSTIAAFLAFEYYHGLRLYKNAARYFEQVNTNLNTFLLSSHCCFTAQFLISKAQYYNQLGTTNKLAGELAGLHSEPDSSDIPGYVYFTKYIAWCHFCEGNYTDAVKLLGALLNDVSMKNFAHSEMEIKLFLALCCSMCNRYEQADLLVRSVSRKLSEMKKDESYENVSSFIKMLKLQMNSEAKDVELKLRKMRDHFQLVNSGERKMLEFLKLDDEFIRQLSLGVKK